MGYLRRVKYLVSWALILAACSGGSGSPDDAGGRRTGDGGAARDAAPSPTDGGRADGGTTERAPGLFVDLEGLRRARARSDAPEFEAIARLVRSRAGQARERAPDPFEMEDVTTIRFGWCASVDDVDDTLREATSKLEADSDRLRTLALAYALDGDAADADAALGYVRAWASRQTVVNLHDLGVDFAAARLDAQTEGYCSDRPWNFALDAMWQSYGLINAADAYLLLSRAGALNDEDDATFRQWLRALTAAVNASFQAWTRWADAHPSSGSFERYRSDNHLSWALAGLMAAAAALEDDALADYVLEGGTWDDGHGAYANPSSIRTLIDLAIEGDGRVYEERILRDPPVGYSFFHLWAITLVARIAEVHFGTHSSIFDEVGEDGGSLRIAFERYAGFLTGERTSPAPDQDTGLEGYRWLYELVLERWPDDTMRDALGDGRGRWIVQSVGAPTLLLGPSLSGG
ncbi:MAG: alginate lyase family protein [Sandaracinus sp.]|nr:alginate lyase family protein [Sandaracinus sp.]